MQRTRETRVAKRPKEATQAVRPGRVVLICMGLIGIGGLNLWASMATSTQITLSGSRFASTPAVTVTGIGSCWHGQMFTFIGHVAMTMLNGSSCPSTASGIRVKMLMVLILAAVALFRSSTSLRLLGKSA